jgi:hypothetical protein
MPARSRSLIAAFALSTAGTLGLWWPAARWRIDVATANGVAGAAPVAVDWARAAVYLVALGLLAAGWRAATRAPMPLGRVLALGAIVHLVALVIPPFLSFDPLCYAAIGRAMARFHASPYRPLIEALPANDPFFARLPTEWQHQGSAYWPAFNGLAWLIARVGSDGLRAQLLALQLVALAAVLATAWLVALAVAASRPHEAGRAAALVLFCPLAIVEGTVSAHNDALLGLSVAAFTVAVARRLRGIDLVALVAGVLVKASGLLLLGLRAVELVCARVPWRPTARQALGFGLLCVGVTIGALLLLSGHTAILTLPSVLVGASDAAPHCTRSLECLPRALFYWGLGWHRAAWLVGLAFRVAGGLWLFFVAWRVQVEGERTTLSRAATGIFIYYLYLHGFAQSWYLLSLLPLMPHAEPRLLPAMRAFVLSSLVYYAVRLPLQSDLTPSVVAAKELIEALLVLVPPTIVLLHRRAGAAEVARALHA